MTINQHFAAEGLQICAKHYYFAQTLCDSILPPRQVSITVHAAFSYTAL
jgi:hypothetical protein